MEIGTMIQYYRKLKGYSRQELAHHTYLSDKAIGHYETGTRFPSVDKLTAIAGALGIETKQLLDYHDEMFEAVPLIENNLDMFIIKETKNLVAIKEYGMQAKEKNQKLVIILNELSTLLPTIFMEHYTLKQDIYFYERRMFRENGLFDMERMKQIKANFPIESFETGDELICIYDHGGRYTITPSGLYKVIDCGIHEEGFEFVEIITDAGRYGAYPKDWFELYQKKR